MNIIYSEPLPRVAETNGAQSPLLKIDPALVAEFLVRFLKDEVIRQRGMDSVVLGLSGGLDSAVVAALCAKAFGAEKVHPFLMPYRVSSPESLAHAELVCNKYGLSGRVIEITQMVDGYLCEHEAEADARRVGNICSRCRTTILFDQSMKLGALPVGTGNKSERLLGYFTWHGDDAPPVNPLGDLFKSQVKVLAKYLEIPEVIVDKPPSADLIQGQTDESDLGVTYEIADPILAYLLLGYSTSFIRRLGYPERAISKCSELLNSTHWKRRMPSTAMLSTTAINEFYLRPLDYR
jgi:NAD+ synthase